MQKNSAYLGVFAEGSSVVSFLAFYTTKRTVFLIGAITKRCLKPVSEDGIERKTTRFLLDQISVIGR